MMCQDRQRRSPRTGRGQGGEGYPANECGLASRNRMRRSAVTQNARVVRTYVDVTDIGVAIGEGHGCSRLASPDVCAGTQLA